MNNGLEKCPSKPLYKYSLPSMMFDELHLEDPTINLVVAAMIYVGCGPHQIKSEFNSKPFSSLLDYVDLARAFGFEDYYIVTKGVNYA